jgi:hypothetical protein
LPYRVFPLNAAPHLRQIRYPSLLHHPSGPTQGQPRRTTKFRTPESALNLVDTLATGFNAQVRSHLVSVLPDTSGRYSLELSTLFTSQRLSLRHSRAYRFTSCSRNQTASDALFGHASSKPEHSAM